MADWLYDVLAFAGLVLLAIGLWWFSPALSLSVLGALLLFAGVVGAWRRGSRPPQQAEERR